MEAAQALNRASIDQPEIQDAAARRRPTRPEIEALLPGLLERRGAEILAHARRFSNSPEDAEDAYQRGLEILLTKAPAAGDDDLVPWLKTVVKHEAFAITRARGRAGLPSEETLQLAASPGPAPDEQAEHYERLRLGAEAISRLKPQEIQAMLLRAEGHSYAEIQTRTGWSYTKVDRCLKEGRRSFVRHVHGIETGAECAELEPLLSAFADGEARATEMLRLRRHLRACAGCRATVGRFRTAPRDLAAIAPPLAAVAGANELAGGDTPGLAQRAYDTAAFWLHDKVALIGVKAQGAVEAAGGAKIAAVAMSSVALAGGGVATVEQHDRDREAGARAELVEARAAEAAVPAPEPAAPPVDPVPQADPVPAPDSHANGNGDKPADPPEEVALEEPEPVQDEFAPSPEPAMPPRSGGGGEAGTDRAKPAGGGGSKGGGAGEFGL
ncbi:MAG: hypothetical protein QOG62_103 [Thermoleophilaceae bacterium]|jgi:RNA polymerase sigma factor (sigma-70 family)|nr:hypothetical protein [Thermoleophilaceae bacterium]